MNIQWIGGTTFMIKNSTGKRFLLDPNKSIIESKRYDFKANVITCNSPDKTEYLREFISKDCKIINSVCNFNTDFVKLKSYKTFKDNTNGLKRGENIIHLLEIDNYKICHLGAIGHMLDSDLINELKGLDYLFIPIGGHFCLNGIEASKLAYSINSKYIIPMYYKSSHDCFYLDGPFKFLSTMKNILTFNDSTIQSSSLSFINNNTVILFNSSI